MGDDPRYPRELERDLTLRDGTRLRLRPIRPDDAPRLQELYGRLSRHTAYQRFFSIMKRLPPDWARMLADVDFRRRLALVAEHDVDGVAELVGVGRYEPTDAPDTAEVAFVVQDGWQDRGLGTVLFQEILAAAAARGVRRFRAWVLADNRRMLDLIARYGAIEQRRTEQGVTELVFTAKP
ncbi:MAG: GNAT family N-acetyltransferase [Candidatus Rokubacteria bacterium]|nr:GNAT family N-acetyltransferase [Candidatus Rokubacteria bacterium]